eukprot:PLAT15497.3.p1 GENE.PLAT15497.3~~PLAT15497.3.p1  ORF type:complete len:178 (+),score=0.18 PLAT15497.3:24-536(+)
MQLQASTLLLQLYTHTQRTRTKCCHRSCGGAKRACNAMGTGFNGPAGAATRSTGGELAMRRNPLRRSSTVFGLRGGGDAGATEALAATLGGRETLIGGADASALGREAVDVVEPAEADDAVTDGDLPIDFTSAGARAAAAAAARAATASEEAVDVLAGSSNTGLAMPSAL